jgi:hypothetical protein
MDDIKWSLVDSKDFYRILRDGSTKITTERMRVWGTRTWIYRDIVEVYEHLGWVVKDIKYVTVKEDEND